MANRVLAALRAQRRNTIRTLASLDDPLWECRASVRDEVDDGPPTVRELAAHLILTDEAVLSTRALMARVRRGGDQRWDPDEISARASRTPGELLAALASLRDHVQRVAATSVRLAGAVPIRGTAGRDTLEQWWSRRVLHEWLHEQDIVAAANGEPALPARDIAETLIAGVLGDLPATSLPRAAVTHGHVRLIVDVMMPAEDDDASVPAASPGRHTWGIDFARKHYGPRVAGLPDATVWLHAQGLGWLAGGRRTPGDLERALLRVEGDFDLAMTVLDAVAGVSVRGEQLSA